jgi:hypothetical protein
MDTPDHVGDRAEPVADACGPDAKCNLSVLASSNMPLRGVSGWLRSLVGRDSISTCLNLERLATRHELSRSASFAVSV